MEILVLVSDYPTATTATMGFVHTRNINYCKFGDVHIDVLSFRAAENYTLDGIPVFTCDEYKTKLAAKKYDLLLSHAPNLREHLKFIRKYGGNFPKIVFFFHGHEVLRRNEAYPWPYPFRKKEILIRRFIQTPYDFIKLMMMKRAICSLRGKIHLVFVSEWMKKQFVKYVWRGGNNLDGQSSVIHNVIGEEFGLNAYSPSLTKKGDFITIRSNLDDSKYAVDIVAALAAKNPALAFTVIGRGVLFSHISAPPNLTVEPRTLRHREIVETLNHYGCALMPTRCDAQGVMACEMAVYGIPLITSDIDVCHEILDGMENIAFISNDNADATDLDAIINGFDLSKNNKKETKFSLQETIGKEMALFSMLTENHITGANDEV